MDMVNARILVVEDDAVMRQYVVATLGRMGVQEVEECANGKEALKLMAAFWPDVVLADVHMEPMDGFDFVRRLRDHPTAQIRQSRVVFMSADCSKSSLSQALTLGILGYIVKPPRVESLRRSVEAALREGAPPLH